MCTHALIRASTGDFMYVIAFASQKGGAGKTTLTGHLAVEAERQGFGAVALIDTDPQASLSDWWSAREAATPAFAHVALSSLTKQLEELRRNGFALVMIDTPPAIAASIKVVMTASDLVVVPTRPSPHDLRAIGRTVEIAEACGKPMVFVINGAAHRARITTSTVTALSQHGAVATTIVHQRTDFAASMITGLTAQEVDPASRSAQEITTLWSYLSGMLTQSRRKSVRKHAMAEARA